MTTRPEIASERLPSTDLAGAPLHLIARLLLAGGFVFSGVNKLLDFGGTVQEMAHNGLPLPALVAATVIATQLGGSLLLLFPRTSWIGAGLLAGFTALATLIAHAPWGDAGPVLLPQSVIFLQNAGILGGLLLAIVGTSGFRRLRECIARIRAG
jgi:uncharacterized membrane protein YphA (DoxX/SURF4 family)